MTSGSLRGKLQKPVTNPDFEDRASVASVAATGDEQGGLLSSSIRVYNLQRGCINPIPREFTTYFILPTKSAPSMPRLSISWLRLDKVNGTNIPERHAARRQQ